MSNIEEKNQRLVLRVKNTDRYVAYSENEEIELPYAFCLYLCDDFCRATDVDDYDDAHDLITSICSTYSDLAPSDFELVTVTTLVEPKYSVTMAETDWFSEVLEELNEAPAKSSDEQ
jgi:hypothetical protein